MEEKGSAGMVFLIIVGGISLFCFLVAFKKIPLGIPVSDTNLTITPVSASISSGVSPTSVITNSKKGSPTPITQQVKTQSTNTNNNSQTNSSNPTPSFTPFPSYTPTPTPTSSQKGNNKSPTPTTQPGFVGG